MDTISLNVDDMPNDFLEFAWDNVGNATRLKLMKDMPRTVWLFGAGASHHYVLNPYDVRVPLANGFFKALNRLPTSQGFHAHVGPLLNYLHHYRGIPPSEASEFDENIEEFMTSVESQIMEFKGQKLNGKMHSDDALRLMALSQVYTNMVFLFTNVINESQNGPVSPVFAYLLKLCTPNDSFVTFNWDTLLDKALAATGAWNPVTGYSMEFCGVFDGVWKDRIDCSSVAASNWKLLKLHGSTNWLVPYTTINLQTLEYASVISEGDKVFLFWQSSLPYDTWSGRWRGGYDFPCYGYYPPNIPAHYFSPDSLRVKPEGHVMLSVKFSVFSPFPEPDNEGLPSSPLIITPVKQKRYELYTTTIENLWQSAETELKTTDRIVIVGYSFPETDVRPLSLLNNVLKKRKGEIEVVIVDPWANAIATKLENELGQNVKSLTPINLQFEEYVKWLWKNKAADLMRGAVLQSQEVRKWCDRIFMLQGATLH